MAKLVERPKKASTAYGMESSAKKTKLTTNNTSGINTETKVNGQKLETVTSFKYLGSVITDEGSKPEILSRIEHTAAALTRLKVRLLHLLVTSIFLYPCEPWTLKAELQRKIHAMEIKLVSELVGALSPVNHKGLHQG